MITVIVMIRVATMMMRMMKRTEDDERFCR